MVYCSKCGALNADNATDSSNCGASLYAAGVENMPYSRREHRHRHYEASMVVIEEATVALVS